MARPSKPESERKSETLCLAVTRLEADLVYRDAGAASVSAVLREKLGPYLVSLKNNPLRKKSGVA